MVCSEVEEAQCVIRDPRSDSQQKRFIIKVRSHYTVAQLYNDVRLQTIFPDFELVLPTSEDTSTTDGITLHDKKHRKLADVGIKFGGRNNLIIIPRVEDYSSTDITVETEMSSDDDLVLGASASPIESSNYNMPAPPPLPAPFETTVPLLDTQSSVSQSRLRRYNGEHSQYAQRNYRGLVNQAMTCYLNSLLQALFMTPEFRNALYNWEFDGEDEGKSIPYQLQKLFVNLQTSPKSAVETTDLTRSFGWDSAEGWQQHDIQELCRVMFDALERKFKNTKQADLINRLYEGKMIDYVKCLECNTEKQREDKFLDIPLPVRPFGSIVAYESIEDAMRAFVQPEILDGNNQYHCETCNKKCDAHKGLKFTKFPYILTLHLKRFDFDYQTFHRIKLNDKVTFPQSLNLNNFINAVPTHGVDKCVSVGADTANGNGIPPMQMETAENFMKTYDECSTTDSGSALEEDSSFQNGTSVSSTTTTPNDHFMNQDDDEGIDMDLNGDSKSPSVSNFNAPGPYVYELFAIMIHSGSASGGHYYAYIKDFQSSNWYSFNDQTVSTITQDDIQKSFGGGASKTYYSGAYSSSTNAYMLMYRQVDPSKNKSPIKEEEFPDHIKKLMSKIRESEAGRSRVDTDAIQVKVYFDNPKTRAIKHYKMYLPNESTLAETLREAYEVLKVKGIVPIERCRLVAYDHQRENIERSFEGRDEETIDDIMKHLQQSSELLLETRAEHEVFEPYLLQGVMTKVYKLELSTRDVEGPISIRASKIQSVLDYKKIIARKLQMNTANMIVAINEYKEGAKLLTDNAATLGDEGFIQYCKVFVTVNNTDDPDFIAKFKDFANRLDHVISLFFVLPNMDTETLKNLAIPRFVAKSFSSTLMNGSAVQDVSMVAVNNDSNSEDSSLSDNDRTLVEDDVVHKQLNGDVSNLHFTNGISTNGFAGSGTDIEEDDEEESYLAECRKNYYFKVSPVEYHNQNSDSGAEEDTSSSSRNEKVIVVLIDKRSSHGFLKYKLQSYLRIPMEYFKLFKTAGVGQQEATNLKEELNVYNDGERLTIELGRVLRKGEYKINLYYFNVNDLTDDTEKLPFLCNWFVRNGELVGQIKRDILAHLVSIDNKYSTLTFDRCRLRKKSWKSISKVFTDDQKIGTDVSLSSTSDMVLQEVDDLDSCTPVHFNDIVILVRRWSPSEMKLGKIQEILFPDKSELKNLLSQLSGIPEENIEYAKLQLRDSVSVMQIHNILQWTSTPALAADSLSNNFLDGNMFYYRDKTEVLKELTPEERKELTKKDIRSSSTYSPRRERALKIYVDASPKKVDD
ncbi:ubiquitin carboxyl-terminal hydrolase 47 isoform X2 [Wyeomyia smithii]|nr:ubiquitin carboxyl-terminal hydrolase 47 isoform X2 [Wyeomyia smithii]XP_055533775.1 ubiquitin carboxyl-terminal hydrolase 47 isoform X2 [Wyeomyia smithii]XP_055533776.1 ubiquitin carboxyl-terminal hydrolase 47 isoform X2 [Wyeomyia smithii]